MGTWRGPDDQAAARFLAEHGMVSGLDGDELVIEAGSEALLPPWPPEGYDWAAYGAPARVGGVGPSGDESPGPSGTNSTGPLILCAVCQTPVARHGEAGWRHEVSLAERGGCQTPWPEG